MNRFLRDTIVSAAILAVLCATSCEVCASDKVGGAVGSAVGGNDAARLHADTEPVACCAPASVRPTVRSSSPGIVRDADERVPEGTSAGMVWIPGGEFTMGSTDPLARRDEAPVHRVRVDGFWMDETEVTNAQFRVFVETTGYITVAERTIDWEELKKQSPPGTPRPPDEELQPGSLVFIPPVHPVGLRDYSRWWKWVDGACWKHPLGPGSSIEGRENHPVVHIAYEDALAYCAWVGKRLPTEAEWEFAARGGLDRKINVWGDEPIDHTRANTWQGEFPHRNTHEDGFTGASPVKSFPPNGYELYDMAGNVWEWCSDLYRSDTYALRVTGLRPDGVVYNPMGPATSFDARHPHEPVVRVQRGGSFLCHDSYCASYRPSARMATSPETGLSHTGFRCVAEFPEPKQEAR